jgi:hypothetical protein
MTMHGQPLIPGVDPFVGDAPEDRHAERVVSPIPSLQIVENNPFGRSVPRQLQTVPMGMITVGNRE